MVISIYHKSRNLQMKYIRLQEFFTPIAVWDADILLFICLDTVFCPLCCTQNILRWRILLNMIKISFFLVINKKRAIL